MEKNTSLSSIISEIVSSPFYRDNPQLIDKPAIYRWAYMALKSFGKSIMYKKEEVIKIENYRGCLPDDFGSLSLAVFCENGGHSIIKGSRDHLMSSYIWKEKLQGEYSDECENNGTEGCVDRTSMCVVERHYFNDGAGEVEIYYKNPVYVKLGRNVLRGGCTDSCVNRSIKDSEYSIDIIGNKIHSNFKSGKIFIEYYAIPQDEDGLPYIPNTKYGYLESYIEYHIRRRMLEEGMLSKDAPNQQAMFQFYLQKENELLVQARNEVMNGSFEGIIKAIDENRKRRARYNVNLGLERIGRVLMGRHVRRN